MRTSRKRGKERILLAVALGVSSLVLTGCTPVAPLYLGFVSGDLAILVCEGVEADRIAVGAITAASGSQADRIWEVVGNGAFDVGDVVIVGEHIGGFDQVNVEYLGVPPDASVLTASLQTLTATGSPEAGPVGSYQAEDLQDGSWLAADGRLLSDPC